MATNLGGNTNGVPLASDELGYFVGTTTTDTIIFRNHDSGKAHFAVTSGRASALTESEVGELYGDTGASSGSEYSSGIVDLDLIDCAEY